MQSKDIFPEANKDIKILDAGAGTGIIGEMLVQQGYRNIDTLDISEEMLNLVKQRNVYRPNVWHILEGTSKVYIFSRHKRVASRRWVLYK